jgi:hypothetical protein
VTEDERTGRRITIGIAWLAGAPPVCLLAAFIAAGYPVLRPPSSATAGAGVLAWLLIKGRRWVRSSSSRGSASRGRALAQLLRLGWT